MKLTAQCELEQSKTINDIPIINLKHNTIKPQEKLDIRKPMKLGIFPRAEIK